MKIINSFLILLCFTTSSFAQPRGWAPFEFTYKTASPAAMCGSWSEEVQVAYDVIVRNDNPVAVEQALDFFKAYEFESPEVIHALNVLMNSRLITADNLKKYNFQLSREGQENYLLELLPLTGDYPDLALLILVEFLLPDVLYPSYTVDGQKAFPNLSLIVEHKDYFCELKHRGCKDFSGMANIDCDQ